MNYTPQTAESRAPVQIRFNLFQSSGWRSTEEREGLTSTRRRTTPSGLTLPDNLSGVETAGDVDGVWGVVRG